MRIYINELHKDLTPRLRWALLRVTGLFLRAEKMDDVEISITFTDDQYIAKLNQSFRGKRGPTDVITFVYDDYDRDYDHHQRAGGILGDIYISVDRAREQAGEDRVTTGHMLLRLLVHGLAHLAGYTHSSPGKRRLMEIREKKALAVLLRG